MRFSIVNKVILGYKSLACQTLVLIHFQDSETHNLYEKNSSFGLLKLRIIPRMLTFK